MQYLGGKARLAPWILDIILKDRTSLGQWYIEPFCGGCNTLYQVEGKRIGIDNCPYLISMWKALQNGWIPPNIVKEDTYKHVQHNKERYKPEVVGFVGYGCSYGGKFFAGYARGKLKSGVSRDYVREAQRTLLKQQQTLKEVKFVYTDSLTINKFPANSLIYCDPPYVKGTKYKTLFNNDKFWQWAK